MRNPAKVCGIIAALILTAPLVLFAGPPANDDFDSPLIMAGFPATAGGTNAEATLQTGEPSPDTWWDAAEASVWFRWTSPTSGPVQIHTLGSDFDTMLAVWSGSTLSNLTLIAENDQYDGGNQSAVFIAALNGVTYQIAVYSWYDDRGSITLDITNDINSRISGTVTGPDGTTPLQGIEANTYRWSGSWWEWVRSAQTDAIGNYSIGGLTAGTYRVQFYDYNGDFLSEVYDNAPDRDSGLVIVVPAETTVNSIDASLANASRISGTVTGPDGNTPLLDIRAAAHRWSGSGWDWVSFAQTDASGNYSIGGLPAGTYRVEFVDWSNGNFLSEVYDNAPDLDSGTNIVVAAETTVTNINASLANASRISGTVTGPDGNTPLLDIEAGAYHWSGSWWEWVSSAQTDASGNYSIGGLTAGAYRVEFVNWDGNFLSEVFDNAPDLDSGTNIVVAAETTVTNINASLANASRITGKVTGPDGATPLRNIEAGAYRWSGSFWEGETFASTDVSGNYSIGGLPAGTYRVQFYDYNGDFLSEVYENAPDLDSGTNIIVAAETTVTNINASLANASTISGTVIGPDGTTPLYEINAAAYRWAGSWWEEVSSSQTDSSGNYSIGGLTAGTYRVEFDDWNGDFLSEVYNNAPDLDSGTDIVVPAGTTIPDIDALLVNAHPPEPPHIVSVMRTDNNDWVIQYVGVIGKQYILQEATLLTNSWSDLGTAFPCGPGTNTVRRQLSELNLLRIRRVP